MQKEQNKEDCIHGANPQNFDRKVSRLDLLKSIKESQLLQKMWTEIYSEAVPDCGIS